jgi:adenylate cyclase
MTLAFTRKNMLPDREEDPAPWAALRRERRAIVVVDMVESVRLMQQHEEDVIRRWRRFLQEVRTDILPRHQGRLVKSLGDGMLLEFARADAAVQAALALQHLSALHNQGLPGDRHLLFRIGLHVATVVVEELDIFGSGVNLAARLATIAEPGDVVLSEDARAALIPDHDAELEDLGPVYLKHVSESVRSYRVLGTPVTEALVSDTSSLQPTLLVAPFVAWAGPAAAQACHGELLAEALNTGLARTGAIRVISNLSARALVGRPDDLRSLSQRMGAAYVLEGYFRLRGETIEVRASLREADTQAVVWEGPAQGQVSELFVPDSRLVRELASEVLRALARREGSRGIDLPLPSLHSASLLLGAIELMHRQSLRSFARAGEMLEHLCDRHPRHATPHTWRAKWHVIAMAQGWSPSAEQDRAQAIGHVERALSLSPDNALAWSIHANVLAYLNHDHRQALEDCDRALATNPSEPLAWLYLGVVSGWRGDTDRAREGARQALSLSPLDPMRYYFDVLAAAALLGAGDLAQSEQLARRSLRANREHLPSHKVLALALGLSGQLEAARDATQEVLRREPGFTVTRFRDQSPWGASPLGPQICDVLAAAGVPVH